MYDGTMNGQFYEFWFRNCLCKEIEKDAVIVIDNAKVHNKTNLMKIADEHKIRLIFQPKYSPDLNKIEHFWAWLKGKLKNILKNYPTLEDAICYAFKFYDHLFCPIF